MLSLLTWITPVQASSATSSAAENAVHYLDAAQWNIPRDVQSILAMPALQAVMHDFSHRPHARLQIKYPGGDEGTLWSSEVRSWLVSLGIPLERIELVPGASQTDRLELLVLPSP